MFHFRKLRLGAALEVAHYGAFVLGQAAGCGSVSRVRLGPRPGPASPFCRVAFRSEQPAQRYVAALLSYVTDLSELDLWQMAKPRRSLF